MSSQKLLKAAGGLTVATLVQPSLGRAALRVLNFSVLWTPEEGHQQPNSSFSKSSHLLALAAAGYVTSEGGGSTALCSWQQAAAGPEHSTRGS